MSLSRNSLTQIILCFVTLTFAMGAMAQSSGLLEKKPEEKVVEVDKDPDPKLLKTLETERKTTEKRLNRLQTLGQKFMDIVEGVNKASNVVNKASMVFYNGHYGALDAYRVADSAGNTKKAKAAAKKVIKLRNDFLKALRKANKMLDKLKKFEAKLVKRLAEQEAEEKKAAGDK